MHEPEAPRLDAAAERRIDAALSGWNDHDVLARPLSASDCGNEDEFLAAVRRSVGSRRLDPHGLEQASRPSPVTDDEASAAIWFLACLPAFLAMQARSGPAVAVAAIGLAVGAACEYARVRADQLRGLMACLK